MFSMRDIRKTKCALRCIKMNYQVSGGWCTGPPLMTLGGPNGATSGLSFTSLTLLTWKVGCVFRDLGSLNLTDTCQALLMSSVCLLGSSGDSCFTLKFCVCLTSHVLSSVVPQVCLIIPPPSCILPQCSYPLPDCFTYLTLFSPVRAQEVSLMSSWYFDAVCFKIPEFACYLLVPLFKMNSWVWSL